MKCIYIHAHPMLKVYVNVTTVFVFKNVVTRFCTSLIFITSKY